MCTCWVSRQCYSGEIRRGDESGNGVGWVGGVGEVGGAMGNEGRTGVGVGGRERGRRPGGRAGEGD